MRIDILDKKEFIYNFLAVVNENMYIDISDTQRGDIIQIFKNANCDINYSSFNFDNFYAFRNLYAYINCDNHTPMISLTDLICNNYPVVVYNSLNVYSRKYKLQKLMNKK